MVKKEEKIQMRLISLVKGLDWVSKI